MTKIEKKRDEMELNLVSFFQDVRTDEIIELFEAQLQGEREDAQDLEFRKLQLIGFLSRCERLSLEIHGARSGDPEARGGEVIETIHRRYL